MSTMIIFDNERRGFGAEASKPWRRLEHRHVALTAQRAVNATWREATATHGTPTQGKCTLARGGTPNDQSRTNMPSHGSNIVSQAHAASIARTHARTHERTERFLGWTSTPILRLYIYIYIYMYGSFPLVHIWNNTRPLIYNFSICLNVTLDNSQCKSVDT